VDRRERIREKAEAIAASEGVELVDLHYRREGPGWVLRLFIDKPGGVTHTDCQEISQQLGAQVEVEDLVPHRYTLEVSSPGLDRPLLKEADYTRFAGRSVRITTDRPVEGRRRFRGRLEGLTDGQVSLTTDEGERFELPLERVASARLEIEF
jgi:ribosome maturation factor RimP